MSDRDVVFVSHANPEDDEFARWLTLKLAALGFRAWSDVTRLLGGEDFWSDIERAIREDTIKFVYVLSKASNHKAGALKELRVAAAVARQVRLSDFIIPVRVDDLPFDDVNIEIGRLNALDFAPSWADGLKSLVAKLEKEGVPRNERYGPDAVRQWWQNAFNVEVGTATGDEAHLSNWFSVRLPDNIYAHTLGGLFESEPEFPFPTIFRNSLLTFAPASDLATGLRSLRVQDTATIPTNTFLSEGSREERIENRNAVTQFLNQAWGMFAQARGLQGYQLANQRIAFYFDQNTLPGPEVHFAGVGGRKAFRALMGYKTVPKGRRHWHFAVAAQAAVHPEPLLMLKTHVFFSDDGVTLWTSPERMHRARRSQCKQWWNDDWRDRLLATMTWLANGAETLRLPVGQSVFAEVSIRPIEFISPVALDESAREDAEALEGEQHDDEHDEDDEDEEDEAETDGTL